MIHKTVHLDGNTDPAAVVSQLKTYFISKGLPANEAEAIISDLTEPITTMAARGREVAKASGQFRARREIQLDRATVTIDAEFGVPVGFFARVMGILTGKG